MESLYLKKEVVAMTGTQSKLKQNMWRLVLIAIAGSMIYGLPYFRSYYYDAYLTTYGLTNTQMGVFGSIFGVMGACSYLFGGVVADMISPRKLMSVSLILTGLGGLLHLMHPSYGMLVFIYLLWGFTSLFAFWPSLLKSLRLMARANEQSKAYGFMDGGRGIVNMIHLAITLAIFNRLSKTVSDLAGLNGVILFYSSVIIVLGVIVFFVLKDDTKSKDDETAETEEKEEKFKMSDIGKVVKLPVVWMLALILCCSYTMNMLFYYFTPYATATMGMTATAGAMITMLAQYVRPVASFSGGIAGDRIGRSNVMYITFALMFLSTLYLTFVNSMSSKMFIVVCIIIYFGMYAAYSMTFSMLEESGVPSQVGGTAIGLICTIGYLPEVFCPLMAGKLLDKYGNAGYHKLFIFLAVMMVIGAVMLTVYRRYIKKKKESGEIEA